MGKEKIIPEYLKFKEKCIEAKMFDLDEIKWLFEVVVELSKSD